MFSQIRRENTLGHTSNECQKGFIFAEQKLLDMMPEELLALEAQNRQSLGQLMRNMIGDPRRD